jgi:hypothetical protein
VSRPCVTGTFSDRPGVAVCERCQAGRFSVTCACFPLLDSCSLTLALLCSGICLRAVPHGLCQQLLGCLELVRLFFAEALLVMTFALRIFLAALRASPVGLWPPRERCNAKASTRHCVTLSPSPNNASATFCLVHSLVSDAQTVKSGGSRLLTSAPLVSRVPKVRYPHSSSFFSELLAVSSLTLFNYRHVQSASGRAAVQHLSDRHLRAGLGLRTLRWPARH